MYISANRWLGKLSLYVSIICFLCISSDAFGFGKGKIEDQKKQIEVLWEQYLALSKKGKNEVITPDWTEILKLSGKYVFNRRYNNVSALTIRDQTYSNPAYFEIDRELSINEGTVCFQSKYSLAPRGEEKSTIKETAKEFKIISRIDKIPNAFRKYETLFLVEMYHGQDIVKGILGYRTGWFRKNKRICEFISFPEKVLDNGKKNKKLKRQYVIFCSQERKNNQVLSINYFGKASSVKEKFFKVDKPEVKSPDVEKKSFKLLEIHVPIPKSNHLHRVD